MGRVVTIVTVVTVVVNVTLFIAPRHPKVLYCTWHGGDRYVKIFLSGFIYPLRKRTNAVF